MKTLRVFFITLLVALICPFFVSAQTYTFEEMTNPDPNSNNLVCITNVGNVLFAGGDNGTLLKYNGSAWLQIANSQSGQIKSIYAASENDVWMTFDNAIFHYNGSTISAVNIGTSNHIMEIIGFAANDIYACGSFGTFYHYNGSNWSAINGIPGGVSLGDMCGLSNDIYLTGEDEASPYTRRMFHYDGVNLTEVVSGVYGYGWYDIWSPDNNLFYLGGRELYKFDKTAGTVDQIFDGYNNPFGFSANCIIDFWNSGMSNVDSIRIYNGTTWKTLQDPIYSVRDLCSPTNNPNNIFIVSDNGVIRHMVITTGIEETALNPTRFDVYPNPATDLVTIDLNFDQKTDTKIELFDVVGQRLELISDFGGNEDQITFNVGELPHGLYLIKVTDREGRVVSKKLTK